MTTAQYARSECLQNNPDGISALKNPQRTISVTCAGNTTGVSLDFAARLLRFGVTKMTNDMLPTSPLTSG